MDPELQTYFKKIKKDIKKEHIDYLEQHPELNDILSDFVSQLILDKPEDVYQYTGEYFKKYSKERVRVENKPLIITAPSGCGKGTLIRRLMSDFPQYFELSVSYTTRHPRKEDKEGVTYHFVSI